MVCSVTERASPRDCKVSGVREEVESTSMEITGTISELSTFEILVDEQSQASGEGTAIKETITLKEGDNALTIIVKDTAGWETIQEFSVYADTKAPTVSMTIESGNEYYQGRAESTIHGKTEPGAKVFLFVYRPTGFEYTPKFDRAWKTVTADEAGEFTFEKVYF